MRTTNLKMCSTAIAALLALPLASGAAFGQQSQGTDQTQPPAEEAEQQAPNSGADQAADAVVATVGSTEILGSDVMTFVGALPPQLQSQPPQMILPMALEQLILRELIIKEARSQNLADDPEVTALVEGSTQTAEDDALVQVWLERELADVVTDEAVQQAYAEAQEQEQENLPPVEQIRPQIEQYLRQQAMQDVAVRLRQDADVVFYDATGQPVEQQAAQAGQGQDAQDQSAEGGSGQASAGAEDATAGADTSDEPSDGQASEDESSGEAGGSTDQSNAATSGN